MTTYDAAVAQQRITISIDENLAIAVRELAAHEHTTVSAVVADALAREVKSRGLLAVIADWEAEHGAFTEDELAKARQDLGW